MSGRRLLFLLLAGSAVACEDPSGVAPAPSNGPSPNTPSTSAQGAPTAKLDRETGCRALIAAVNRAVDESHTISGKISGDGTQQLEALAASASRAKAEVEKLAIDDAKVSAAQGAYLKMLETTASAATKTVAAARAQDFEAMEKASDALTKAVASEEKVIADINVACGLAPPPGP